MEQIILAPALSLWTECGLPPDELRSLKLDNCPDPVVKSNFKLGTVAQVRLPLKGLLLNEQSGLWTWLHLVDHRYNVDFDRNVSARGSIFS